MFGKYWLRGLAAFALGLLVLAPAALGQDSDRKVKSKVEARYPELARSMHLAGSVKVQVTITPAGTVKSTKVIGGHPLLVRAVLDVIDKWKFEPASGETTQIMSFNFHP